MSQYLTPLGSTLEETGIFQALTPFGTVINEAVAEPGPFHLSATAAISLSGGLIGLAANFGFNKRVWRIPTNAAQDTPVRVMVFDGSWLTHTVRVQAAAIVDALGNIEVKEQDEGAGVQRLAFVHDYDELDIDNINGGAAIATSVYEEV